MVQAGILAAKSGKVRLLKREELSADWDPLRDQRLTVWRIAQQLIVILEEHGEAKAAELFKKVGSLGDTARDLAYRLYNICDRKKWAQEANAYNSLVIAWPEIVKLAGTEPARRAAQGDLY
jgi:putative DNA methylase